MERLVINVIILFLDIYDTHLFVSCVFSRLTVNSMESDTVGPCPHQKPHRQTAINQEDTINQEVLSLQGYKKNAIVISSRRGAGQGKMEEIFRN